MVKQVVSIRRSQIAPVLLLQMLAFLCLYVLQFRDKTLPANYVKGRRRTVQDLKTQQFILYSISLLRHGYVLFLLILFYRNP